MKHFLAILVSAVILAGCSKSVDSKTEQITYPLALGNQWTYSVVVTQAHGDPIRVDTLFGLSDTVTVTVTRVDTVPPGVPAYTMSAVDVGYPMIDGPPERTYLNYSEGMYLLSMKTVDYFNAGLALPRRVAQPPYALSTDDLSSQPSSSRWLTAAFPDPEGPFNSQVADPADTLPLVFPYPQRTGLLWVYRDSSAGRPFRTDKMIEGRETITTQAGTFDCWRMRFIFPTSGGVDFVEYVSTEGLVRYRIEGGPLNDRRITSCDLISFTLH